ncbi:unnamed protein product [Schistosoma mattheei]|uniref:Reverse transcriptase RNase H-like domain-containing protein n=1 Tax=Schistosoma mattheei TaxID=31246 RepID=A0A3P8HE56_9TREM|nr:unnamed protein product [Schistosoma mattheei]
MTFNSFKWGGEQASCLRALLKFLQSDAVLRTYSSSVHSVLHKYLLGKKFTIVTEQEAFKFIYHPEKSLARSSAAMVQRWNIALSAYDYTVQHSSVKQI